MSRLALAKDWARRVKRDAVAVYFAARDPRTPLLARCLALTVAGYALSPIDLIPDFIPVIGLLDDIILVPMGIALAVRLTPPHLWQARMAEAEASADKLPRLWWGVLLIVLIWLLVLGLFAWWLAGVFSMGVQV